MLGLFVGVLDVFVIYLALQGFGIEYVDIWRAVLVVVFSWLVGFLLLPFLILSVLASAGSLAGPWLGVLFGALTVFIAVKYVMMVDWDVAAKVGGVFLVWKVVMQLLMASCSH